MSAKPRYRTNNEFNEVNEDSGDDESEEFFLASQCIEASNGKANSAASGNEGLARAIGERHAAL